MGKLVGKPCARFLVWCAVAAVLGTTAQTNESAQDVQGPLQGRTLPSNVTAISISESDKVVTELIDGVIISLHVQNRIVNGSTWVLTVGEGLADAPDAVQFSGCIGLVYDDFDGSKLPMLSYSTPRLSIEDLGCEPIDWPPQSFSVVNASFEPYDGPFAPLLCPGLSFPLIDPALISALASLAGVGDVSLPFPPTTHAAILDPVTDPPANASLVAVTVDATGGAVTLSRGAMSLTYCVSNATLLTDGATVELSWPNGPCLWARRDGDLLRVQWGATQQQHQGAACPRSWSLPLAPPAPWSFAAYDDLSIGNSSTAIARDGMSWALPDAALNISGGGFVSPFNFTEPFVALLPPVELTGAVPSELDPRGGTAVSISGHGFAVLAAGASPAPDGSASGSVTSTATPSKRTSQSATPSRAPVPAPLNSTVATLYLVRPVDAPATLTNPESASAPPPPFYFRRPMTDCRVVSDTLIQCVTPRGVGARLRLELHVLGAVAAAWPTSNFNFNATSSSTTAPPGEWATAAGGAAWPLHSAAPLISGVAVTQSEAQDAGTAPRSLDIPPDASGVIGVPFYVRPGDVLTLYGANFGERAAAAVAWSASAPGEMNADAACVFLGSLWPGYSSVRPYCNGVLDAADEGEVPSCALMSWNDTEVRFMVPPNAVGTRSLSIAVAGASSAVVLAITYSPPAILAQPRGATRWDGRDDSRAAPQLPPTNFSLHDGSFLVLRSDGGFGAVVPAVPPASPVGSALPTSPSTAPANVTSDEAAGAACMAWWAGSGGGWGPARVLVTTPFGSSCVGTKWDLETAAAVAASEPLLGTTCSGPSAVTVSDTMLVDTPPPGVGAAVSVNVSVVQWLPFVLPWHQPRGLPAASANNDSDTIATAPWVLDSVAAANATAEYGYAPPQLLGLDPYELLLPPADSAADEVMQRFEFIVAAVNMPPPSLLLVPVAVPAITVGQGRACGTVQWSEAPAALRSRAPKNDSSIAALRCIGLRAGPSSIGGGDSSTTASPSPAATQALLPLGAYPVSVEYGGVASTTAAAAGAEVVVVVTCAPGGYGAAGHDERCSPCPAGAYCPGGSSGADASPRPSARPLRGVAPVLAAPGYYDVGGAVAACEDGAVSSGATGAGVDGRAPFCIMPCEPASSCLGANVCAFGAAATAGGTEVCVAIQPSPSAGVGAPPPPGDGGDAGLSPTMTATIGVVVTAVVLGAALLYAAAPRRRTMATLAAKDALRSLNRRWRGGGAVAAAQPPLGAAGSIPAQATRRGVPRGGRATVTSATDAWRGPAAVPVAHGVGLVTRSRAGGAVPGALRSTTSAGSSGAAAAGGGVTGSGSGVVLRRNPALRPLAGGGGGLSSPSLTAASYKMTLTAATPGAALSQPRTDGGGGPQAPALALSRPHHLDTVSDPLPGAGMDGGVGYGQGRLSPAPQRPPTQVMDPGTALIRPMPRRGSSGASLLAVQAHTTPPQAGRRSVSVGIPAPTSPRTSRTVGTNVASPTGGPPSGRGRTDTVLPHSARSAFEQSNSPTRVLVVVRRTEPAASSNARYVG